MTAVDVCIEEIQPGAFEEYIVAPPALPCREKQNRYLYGDCYLLALAVSALTGWPVATVKNGAHWMVRTPDGRLLDAAGLHDASEPIPVDMEPFRSMYSAHPGWVEYVERACRQPDVRADAAELLWRYERALQEAS